MAGRHPLGPTIVEHLDGSPRAKQRLKTILETLTGGLPIAAACDELEISEAMFHKLRNQVLQACLQQLEPKPRGRRPRSSSLEATHAKELEAEVDQLRDALATMEVRLELAQVLPQVVKPPEPLKKTSRPRRRKRDQRSSR